MPSYSRAATIERVSIKKTSTTNNAAYEKAQKSKPREGIQKAHYIRHNQTRVPIYNTRRSPGTKKKKKTDQASRVRAAARMAELQEFPPRTM